MTDFKERIKKTGLSIGFVADLLGVNKNVFSSFLSEDRSLSMDRITNLIKIIEHYERSLQEIKERL